MKKIFLISFISFFLISGFLIFQKAHELKVLPSQAEVGNSVDQKVLNSFKGVIDMALEQPVVQKIAEEVSTPKSPFQNQAQTDEESKNGDILTFAVMGDTQSFKAENQNGNFQQVVKDIAADNPDLVIATGDLTSSCDTYSDCVTKHNNWKKVDAPLISKTYAAMGNHDNVGNKGVKAWQDVFDFPKNGPGDFSELTYSFDVKNSHFVFLASDDPDQHQVNKAQRDWLEQDLASNKKENTFVVFHEPAFPVSSKIGEGLDAQKSDRNALWSIFDKYNVTAVFNGHEHIVSRRKIDSTVFPGAKNTIYQFVFGSTDSFNHDLPQSGVAEFANQGQGRFGLVSVDGKKITVKTMTADNKELDSFTFSK
jgi:Icc protein